MSNKINKDIKAKNVCIISESGIGDTISIDEALLIASEKNLDLVQVSPDNNKVLCKIYDYGKSVYEKTKQNKKSKKTKINLKEIKLRPNTDIGDLKTKVSKIEDFLKNKDEVRIVVQFKGREQSHKEIGYNKINKVLELINFDYSFKQDVQSQGRFITCVLK